MGKIFGMKDWHFGALVIIGFLIVGGGAGSFLATLNVPGTGDAVCSGGLIPTDGSKEISMRGFDGLEGIALGTAWYMTVWDDDIRAPLEKDLQLASTGIKQTAGTFKTGQRLFFLMTTDTTFGTGVIGTSTVEGVWFGKDKDGDGYLDPAMGPSDAYVVPCVTSAFEQNTDPIAVQVRARDFTASGITQVTLYQGSVFTKTTGKINKTTGASPGTDGFTLTHDFVHANDNEGFLSCWDPVRREMWRPVLFIRLEKVTDAVNGIEFVEAGMTRYGENADGDVWYYMTLSDDQVANQKVGSDYVIDNEFIITPTVDMSSFTGGSDDSYIHIYLVFRVDINYWIKHGHDQNSFGKNAYTVINGDKYLWAD